MMYTKSIPIVAALALAPQAMAEPSGNNMLLMSTRDIFGLESRSDSSYNPKAAVCGMGSDCSSVSSTPLFASCLDCGTDQTTNSAAPVTSVARRVTSTFTATMLRAAQPAAAMVPGILAILATTATLAC